MPTAAQGEGLYVGFPIKPHKEITRFVKNIPQSIGEPINPSQLMVTAMYPDELGDRGLSREERRNLFPLIRKITRECGHVSIVGSVMQPSYGELVPDKKFAAIAVDPSDELITIRSRIAEIVAEDLGIRLPSSHPTGWRVPVARRSSRGESLAPYKKSLPNNLVIKGIHVDVEPTKPRYSKKSQPYANRPRNLRRR